LTHIFLCFLVFNGDSSINSNIVQRSLDLLHLRFNSLFLSYIVFLTFSLFICCEEYPIEKFHGDLDVVLKLPLRNLIACN